uniref:Putative ixodes 10 kDa peptide protein n=1 Tax=Ixodes ricinus TaxID=34613 RepID=A0A0K8RAQ2_IXORI
MCRNISPMLLVLFAVLLILPESQGKGSGIFLWECYLAVKNVGDIFCTLYGYGRFESLIYRTCQLVCGERYVQLPEDACSRGAHETCTRRLKNQLQKWGTAWRDSVLGVGDRKASWRGPGISAVAEDCAVFSLGPDLL